VDRSFVSATNPLGLNYSQFNKLLDGTLTTGQNNQANYFAFTSIGASIKQFEALRFEVINSPPDAKDDAFSAVEDTTKLIKVSDLLANDADADGNPLSVTAVRGTGGVAELVTLGGEEFVRFTTPENFNGPASFTYTVSDGKGGTDTATVAVNVAPVNDAPASGGNGSASGDEDTTIRGSVPAATDVDGPSISYLLVSGPVDADNNPVGGTLTLNPDGTYSYAPPANYHGQVTFAYKASDGGLDSAPATVTLAIAPVNDAPEAPRANSVAIDEDTASGPIVIGASDIDGPAFTYAAKAGAEPSKGSVVFDQANGRFTYTPDANLNGADGFTILISDGRGGTAEQAVSVTINAVNDAPYGPVDTNHAANNVAENAAAGTLVGITARASDVDAGDTLTYHFKDNSGNYIQNNGRFTIDAATGEVRTARAFDYETDGATQGLTIWAKDSQSAATSQSFTVGLTDVSEGPPLALPGDAAGRAVRFGADLRARLGPRPHAQ